MVTLNHNADLSRWFFWLTFGGTGGYHDLIFLSPEPMLSILPPLPPERPI
jgi:hypothetical protein